MSTWTDRLAAAYGISPLSEEQAERLLDASRDVSHRVERKETPLTTFLVGAAAGAAVANGSEPGEALDAALTTLARELPDTDPPRRPEGP